ncbi:MAG: hypothetical protein WB630_05230 [Candidatus Acidiferrales bacterium]
MNQVVSLLQFSGSLLDAIFQLYLGLAVRLFGSAKAAHGAPVQFPERNEGPYRYAAIVTGFSMCLKRIEFADYAKR